LRVLLLNHVARPVNGGANRVVVETCRFLSEHGHETLLGCYVPGPSEVPCRVEVIPHGGPAGAIRDLCRQWKPDVVQIHSVPREDVLAEVAESAPSTLFLHDQTWFCSGGDRMTRNLQPCHRPHGLSCLAWHFIQGCAGRSPIGNLALWRRTQRLGQFRGLPRIRLQVASRFMREGLLENGINPARIDLVPLYAHDPGLPKTTSQPGLLFLPSRLFAPKGVHVAIDAVSKLRELPWKLVIAGEGRERPALESQVRTLSLEDRIQFVGEISPAETAQWYDRCQIVLFPVLRHEPFGLVGVEALAHGRPIVAFGGGGAEEWLVDGESAVRVPDRSSGAFADAIALLLNDPIRCQRLADGARRNYTPFRPDAYLARLMASFEAARAGFGQA
jgi:glycosyltransferase involved in cell wall biosynthesis